MEERTERAEERAPESDPADSASGVIVGGSYRLLERLGRGGMADVYEAEHLRLGNRVAIKLLRTSGRADRSGVERFHHEARRVAALSSDHIVKVFDRGELANGAPYLVMERLWGEDLRSLLEREGKLPIRRAVELAIGACRGLTAVHAAGLVHRDLKPANLFVVRTSDGTECCKILDFGVAKALVSDATARGALLGTVRYMAPEQLEDAASARSTADVYATGAILYECLTGSPPHTGETLQELMFNILHRPIVRPSELCTLPEELERIVLKALARAETARFSRVELMARALAPFGAVRPSPRGAEGVDADTLDEDPEPDLRPPSARHRWRTAILWVVGSGVALIGILALLGGARLVSKEPAPTPARPVAPVPSGTAAAVAPETKREPAPPATSSEPRDPAPGAALKGPRIVSKPTTTAMKAARPTPQPAEPERFDSQNPYSD